METWDIKGILDWTTRYFAGKGIEAARLEAELLLAHALQKDRVYLYAQFDAPCSMNERAAYKELINRRVQGEPLAYITGVKEFMSLPFQVDRRVLIPRPDTEVMVEEVIRLGNELQEPVICDLGSGSGAIAVSLAHYLPRAEIWAVDISAEALELVRSNADRHKAAVQCWQSDLFDSMPEGMCFDIVAANLPYISDVSFIGLNSGVRENEPELALKGGGDGLNIYRRLLPQTARFVKPGGYLLLEMDSEQEGKLCSIVEACGAYERLETLKDLAGKSRVVKSRRKSL